MNNYQRGEGDSGAFIGLLIVVGIVVWIWQPQWLVKRWYSEGARQVSIAPKPHDCEFMTAPLGDKHCHYDKVIDKVMWATSTRGDPIRSFDSGKSWNLKQPGKCYTYETQDCPELGDPPGNKAPQYPTVTAVTISWKKVED